MIYWIFIAHTDVRQQVPTDTTLKKKKKKGRQTDKTHKTHKETNRCLNETTTH